MPGMAAKVLVSEKQWAILDECRRSRSVPEGIKQRATIVLLAFDRLSNQEIAPEVDLNRQQVGVWRQRWRSGWDALCVWECTEPRRLREAIVEMLSDAPRSGSPGKFTAEEVSEIVALACESPDLSGRPITRWTHRELRDEILKRQIVASISLAHVGVLLRQAATQPHRTRIWLTTTEKDPEKFQREVEAVCQTYLDAPALSAANGTRTVSVDEATSLQALEPTVPDKPTQPGSVAKREFEYVRHGTTTLTANLDVVIGEIISPTLEPTRTEPEFARHIDRTIALDPCARWVFVLDGLNTHASESLVRFVAEQCDMDEDLGKKVFAAS